MLSPGCLIAVCRRDACSCDPVQSTHAVLRSIRQRWLGLLRIADGAACWCQQLSTSHDVMLQRAAYDFNGTQLHRPLDNVRRFYAAPNGRGPHPTTSMSRVHESARVLGGLKWRARRCSFLRARNSVVRPCTTLAGMAEQAIRRAALITLRRAICERFPPGPEWRAWLRWVGRCDHETRSEVRLSFAPSRYWKEPGNQPLQVALPELLRAGLSCRLHGAESSACDSASLLTRTRKSPKQSLSFLMRGSTRTGPWCVRRVRASMQFAAGTHKCESESVCSRIPRRRRDHTKGECQIRAEGSGGC
jgi:hypothetical protein